AQLGRAEAGAGLEDGLAIGDVRPARIDVLTVAYAALEDDVAVVFARVFLHDHRIGAGRYGRAGHNPNRGAGRYWLVDGTAGGDDCEHLTALRAVTGQDGIPVDGRGVERG